MLLVESCKFHIFTQQEKVNLVLVVDADCVLDIYVLAIS